MTMLDLDDLAGRLAALGEMLDFDDDNPAEAALARLDGGEVIPLERHRNRHRMLLVAAAVVAVVVAAGVLLPDTRTAVARWFGLTGVEVRLDPDLQLGEPQTFDLPGPGASTVVVVNGQRILVSAIRGQGNAVLIDKTVNSSTQVEEVLVNGHGGLWFGGGTHEVLYQAPDGDVSVDRVAANTLLWFDDGVLYRVEGFDDLADAMAFAQKGT
jgi:hypothetical protein